MPKFNFVDEITPDCHVGWRQRTNTKVWHVRFYSAAHRKYQLKSLGEEFDESKASLKRARAMGSALYEEIKDSLQAGDDPTAKRTPKSVADAYYKEISKLAAEQKKKDKCGRPLVWRRRPWRQSCLCAGLENSQS